MGTIAEKLAYLAETKDQIRTAIAAKGVEVPEGTPFREYTSLIAELAGNLTDSERAEINAELEVLLSETDAEWTETLGGYSIAAKIRFLQLCRNQILTSISGKGVTVPETQPFRTIFTLIDQISGSDAELWAYLNQTTLYIKRASNFVQNGTILEVS